MTEHISFAEWYRKKRDANQPERKRQWKEENRATAEAWNDWHEKHGLPLEKYRQF